MSVPQDLWTVGNFVTTPKGENGMVRAFNQTTNMVTVQFGATGFVDALAQSMATESGDARKYMALHEAQLVADGLVRDYHFTQLRRGYDPREE